MPGLLVAFISSFICTLLIIRFEHLHSHISGDIDFSAPQKFHTNAVPRIGGIAVALGITLSIIFRIINKSPNPFIEFQFLACSLPAFAIGTAEDLTKKIGVKTRLLFIIVSAALAIYYLDALILGLGIRWVDNIFVLPGIAVGFTIFSIAGLTNAFNIIDGFNGLASMVGIISLTAIAYINYLVGELQFFSLSLALVGAILGFFIWNYPKGQIFLGDGGSYLIGFWIATLSILLVTRNPSVSPWFALSVNAYPALETLFTIYRRKIHQGRNPDEADGMHFHTLIYRRVLKKQFDIQNPKLTNSRTSPYLWILSGLPVIASMLWWNSTPTLAMCCLLFILGYLWLYQKIVRFKTPRWLHFF